MVLFKRTTRSMTLTPAGRTLLRNVERLLDQADSALHQVQQMGRGEGGHMVVGMVGTSAWGGLIAALRRFSERSAGVTWSLNELTPSQQIITLQKRHIDIGVWREAQQQTLPGLTCQRLASESIAVVLPLDHPLAQQENIPLAALQNDSFIVLPPHEASLGLYLHNLCLQQDFCRTSLIRLTSRKPCWRWWRKAAALRCCRTATAAFRGPAYAFARCNRRRRQICTRFTAQTASRRWCRPSWRCWAP